jgi:thioredoxin-like negative regulator of GroEL
VLFGEMPEPVRWAAGELGARVDLAAARTLRGDLAGAENALAAVFTLELDQRTEAVARRLINLGRALGATRYRNAVEASRISEAIEDFTTRSLPRGVIRAIN